MSDEECRPDLGRGMKPDLVILDEAAEFLTRMRRAEPDPAEELMAAIMLRAARFAPRGGRIRFRAIDRREDGDHVVRSAEVGTEDARRIAGLDP